MGHPQVTAQGLIDTARALVADDKRLLAMDESTPTCNRRFARLGFPQTEEARRAYRELIVTTPGLAECISGAILYDETIRQRKKDGTSFVRAITVAGIVPGIKVDSGANAGPRLLVIDEVGYLSYSSRHADLLFELVSRRYEHNSTLVTTNRPFAEWREVFPNAACVVSLVDRLVHNAEVLAIEGESYRLKEARERSEQRARQRRKAKS